MLCLSSCVSYRWRVARDSPLRRRRSVCLPLRKYQKWFSLRSAAVVRSYEISCRERRWHTFDTFLSSCSDHFSAHPLLLLFFVRSLSLYIVHTHTPYTLFFNIIVSFTPSSRACILFLSPSLVYLFIVFRSSSTIPAILQFKSAPLRTDEECAYVPRSRIS